MRVKWQYSMVQYTSCRLKALGRSHASRCWLYLLLRLHLNL